MKNKPGNKLYVPLAIVLFILFTFLAIGISSFGKKGNILIIKRGSDVIEEIDLSLVEEPYRIDLDTNVILVERDGATVVDATCPDKSCVHRGKISGPGESAVCLPNRILVEIKGGRSPVDGVAGAR